jgi:ABC-type sugar transport system substrate-binding protein
MKSAVTSRLGPALLAVVLATALAACGSGSQTAATGSSSAQGSGTAPAGAVSVDVGTGTITPHDTGNIAVMLQAGPTYSDTQNKAEGAQAAAEELGVTAEIFYSNLDPATELTNYNTIINSGKYGAIVVQAVSPQLCKQMPQDAITHQILVAVIGGPLCATGTETGEALRAPGTLTYVDQNNLINGATDMYNGAAEMLGDGPQKVLLVFGSQGHPTVVAHETAWDTFAAAHPDWEVVGKVYTDWTTPGAYATTQNLLQANPDATVAFSTYVDITAGLTKAIADQGLSDKISVFESSGGTTVSTDLIKSGALEGSVPIYSYDVAYAGVKAIDDAANGRTVPAFIRLDKYSEIPMITQANLDQYSER